MMLFSLMCQDKLSVPRKTQKKNPSFLIASLMISASRTSNRKDGGKVNTKEKLGQFVDLFQESLTHLPPPPSQQSSQNNKITKKKNIIPKIE